MYESRTTWKALAIGVLAVLGLLFVPGGVTKAQEFGSFAGRTDVSLDQIVDVDSTDDIAIGDVFEGPAESDNISLTFRWTVTDIERSPSNPDIILITGNHECIACVGGTVGCNPGSADGDGNSLYIGTFVTTDRAVINKNDFGIALEAEINANLRRGTDVPAVLPATTDGAFVDAPGGHFHGNGRINYNAGTITFRSYGLVYFFE